MYCEGMSVHMASTRLGTCSLAHGMRSHIDVKSHDADVGVVYVQGHVRMFQQEPFILLLATYKPALNQTCLTLPCGWVRRSQHTDWNKAVSKILFDSTGEKVHVMATIATAKSVGCPHLAPERVKMVTAEVGRGGLWSTLPPCGFQRGPRSSISPSNAIFTPVHAGVRSRSTRTPFTPSPHTVGPAPHTLCCAGPCCAAKLSRPHPCMHALLFNAPLLCRGTPPLRTGCASCR